MLELGRIWMQRAGMLACACAAALAGCAAQAPSAQRSPTAADVYFLGEAKVEFGPQFDIGLWPERSGESAADVQARIGGELAARIEQEAQAGPQGRRRADVIVRLESVEIAVDASRNVGSITSSLAGRIDLVKPDTGEIVAGFPIEVMRREQHMSGTFSLPFSGKLANSVLSVNLDWLLSAFAARMLLRLRGQE